jgi:DNA (cytosine-5)-methyltransferase 1
MSTTSRKNKHAPAVLDIFCGAGGMSLGFQNAGCRILGGIDENKHAIATHHKNFPNCKFSLPAQDIRSIKDLSILNIQPGEVDILIGGPPCQVFSRVGIGKMKDLGRNIEEDPRNFLYKEFVRFLTYYKPSFFVMENVDNLVNKKETFSKICNALRNGVGRNRKDYPRYELDFAVLDASRFGVPQKRMRLFIVGVRSDLGIDPLLPKSSGRRIVSVGEAIGDLPAIEPLSMPLRRKSSGPKQADYECFYPAAPQSEYQQKMRRRQKSEEGVWNHLCRAHNEKDLLIFEMLNEGGKYRDLPSEMMRYRDDIFDDKYKRLIWDEPSWTLTAHMKKDGLAYIHPLQPRSISVREAARIQSFPDDFIFYAPMTRMFELVGNSVPPLLAEAVAKPIVRVLESLHTEGQVAGSKDWKTSKNNLRLRAS